MSQKPSTNGKKHQHYPNFMSESTPLSKYETVIGLEVHAQLMTESKIFAPDANKFGSAPNTNISPITLGHPGVLPKLNKKAVEFAIKMGLASGSEITRNQYFDRKNYFYPDLPKGYQITQDKTPICVGGSVMVRLKDGTERPIAFHHIHLEEDAGKSIHADNETDTLLDYNRAGTPLIEMVTDPCIKSAEEAATFMSEIRKLVRYLGICDGNMEEGSLRCDVNISLRLQGSQTFGTKVEIKNMNSMRFIQRAIEYEVERQGKMLDNGETIIQETRMFDPATGQTYGMREKETMNDYRYFPEPDLAPLHISETWLQEIKANLPETPRTLFLKFQDKYGLAEYDASVLTDTRELAEYFEQTCQHTQNYKAVANWISNNIKAQLREDADIKTFSISPERLAQLISLIDQNQISNSLASQKLFPLMMQALELSALEIAQKHGLVQESDTDLLQTWIDAVISENPEKVQEFKKGKKGLIGMFMGELMKKSKGQADPKASNALMMKSLME